MARVGNWSAQRATRSFSTGLFKTVSRVASPNSRNSAQMVFPSQQLYKVSAIAGCCIPMDPIIDGEQHIQSHHTSCHYECCQNEPCHCGHYEYKSRCIRFVFPSPQS